MLRLKTHKKLSRIVIGPIILLIAVINASCKNRDETKALAAKIQKQKPKVVLPQLPDDVTPGGPYSGRIADLFSDGAHLYACGWHMGVYRSEDGKSWKSFAKGIMEPADIVALAGDGAQLLALAFDGALYQRESDSWRLLHDLAKDKSVTAHSLAVTGGRIIVGAGNGLYVSIDGGQSFTLIWSGATVSAIVVKLGRIIFGTMGKGLYSCDGDLKKCAVDNEYAGAKMIGAMNGAGEDLLVLSEGDGVYRRSSKGTAKLEAGGAFPTALFFDGTTTAVAAEKDGLYLRREDAAKWNKIAFPGLVTSITRHKGALYFGTNGLGVFRIEKNRFVAVNDGLLNYPTSVVDEWIRATGDKVAN